MYCTMVSLALTRLVHRKLLRITGPDCYPYLQGLLSNDIRYLYDPTRQPGRKHAIKSPNALSTFMLNPLGKVICDMILYRTPVTRSECEFTPPGEATVPDELLIECDSSLASGVANTLYGYRVRRKISLSLVEDLNLWCLYPTLNIDNKEISEQNPDSLIKLNNDEIVTDNLVVVNDPRLASMGLRIISSDIEPDKVKRSLETIINTNIQHASMKDYTMHRYSLGLGEGAKDHPESACFPLECNADYLDYVSFSKGCYLGQELTARVYHTGVVRKRLMPIILDLESSSKGLGTLPLIEGSNIIAVGEKKQKIGVLRNVIKNRGLALLRHELALESGQLIHEGSKTKLSTYVPHWWKNK